MPEARTYRTGRPSRRRGGPCPAGARKPGAPGRLALALLGVFSLAACSGAGAAAPTPTAILSTTVAAEGELRHLMGIWARASGPERLALEIPLQQLKQKYPADPLGKQVDALLAWLALERGDDPHGAQVLAQRAEKAAGAGTVGDVARTVQGAALRRQGRPVEALALLDPLRSKLIDGWARSLFNEEIVAATLDAGRWDDALDLVGVWLREAGPEERATVRERIAAALGRVPAFDLSRWMLARAGKDRGAEALAEEELEIRRVVAQRLAEVALANKDAELAHQLLATAGNLLGEQSEAVAQLATGANRARAEAQTVGLLLSLRNDKTRRRGAAVADGVAFGLGLPGSPARLVSRDDKGSPDRIEEALVALSADGASIIIAGCDEQEATLAAAFAESRQIPVILLRPPAAAGRPARPQFSFVIGMDPTELEDALVAALTTRGVSPLAMLVDEPIRPRAPRPEITAVRGCSEAAASWRPLGVGGVILEAQPDCARAALVAAAPQRLRFAAGFESETLALPAGSVVATAGLFPVALGQRPPALAGWLKAHPTPPSFWTALGRDAAVLAWAGVKVLPAQGTEDPREVAGRRTWALSALELAQAELWTTEARGFAGGRTLPRTLTVREVGR
jgi:hypothetical protein